MSEFDDARALARLNEGDDEVLPEIVAHMKRTGIYEARESSAQGFAHNGIGQAYGYAFNIAAMSRPEAFVLSRLAVASIEAAIRGKQPSRDEMMEIVGRCCEAASTRVKALLEGV